jgi:hypothetical protein
VPKFLPASASASALPGRPASTAVCAKAALTAVCVGSVTSSRLTPVVRSISACLPIAFVRTAVSKPILAAVRSPAACHRAATASAPDATSLRA